MGCNCGKPKCDGQCGCKSPAVLQINNPPEYITFHKVSVPAAMGDSTTNPPAVGKYKNVLLYYEADQTSWLYSTDGIPTKLTNGITNYEDAINLPQINGHTLLGNQSSSDLGLQGELTAGANIQINNNVISATDTTYTAGDGIELDGTEIKAKIGDGLEFDSNGEIDIADIEQYAHFFDNVASMKNADNLINGSYARTMGYHAKNDGGGATYKIRNITNDDVIDEASIIEMNDPQNQLVAELITSIVYPEMFGAYGDGTHNDTTAFENAISYTSVLTLNKNKTYKLTNLVLTNDLTINGNGSKLIDDSSVDKFIECTTLDGAMKYVIFNDVILDTPNSNYGIYIHSNHFRGNKVKIYNPITACFACYKGTTSGRYGNFIIDDITCETSGTGVYIDCTDANLSNYRGHNIMTHIDVRSGLTHINHVHGWNFNSATKDWITGSVLMNIQGDVVMNDIYSDTLETTFVLPTGSQYMSVEGTNIGQFLNTSSYPNTQASPLLVKNIENYSGWIKLANISVNANNWKDTNNQQPILFPTAFSQNKVSFDNVISIGYRNTNYIPVVKEGDVQSSEYTITETNYLSPNTRKRWEFKQEKRMHWYFTLKRSLPNNTCIFSAQMTENSSFSNISELSKKVSATAKFVSSSTQGLTYELDASLHNGTLAIYNHTGVSLDQGAVVFNYSVEDV